MYACIHIYTVYIYIRINNTVCILIPKHPASSFSFRLGHTPISKKTLMINIISTHTRHPGEVHPHGSPVYLAPFKVSVSLPQNITL